MPPRTTFPLGVALLIFAQFAVAQGTLGELLDAGGRMLSAQEFRQEVVQRMIVGPTATGGTLEVLYSGNGTIAGFGTFPGEIMGAGSQGRGSPIDGEWKIDDRGKICTGMMVGKTVLPFRCQFWFKLDKQYFLSDSDSDRSVRVTRRALKQ